LWAFERPHLVPSGNRGDRYDDPFDVASDALELGIHGGIPLVGAPTFKASLLTHRLTSGAIVTRCPVDGGIASAAVHSWQGVGAAKFERTTGARCRARVLPCATSRASMLHARAYPPPLPRTARLLARPLRRRACRHDPIRSGNPHDEDTWGIALRLLSGICLGSSPAKSRGFLYTNRRGS